jgi:hypothetical protein
MSVARTRLIGLAGDMSGLTIIQCATVSRLAASNAVERNSFGAGDEASDTSLLPLELRGYPPCGRCPPRRDSLS